MRIARLDLTAFGHFTGRSIDFPAADIDLHVIYGPNEAGKSTLRAALLDWFYGIHAQTDYDFKHGYAKMEIGGLIEAAPHGALAFRRFKRNKNPLIGPDGNPLTDADLKRWLHDTDRDAFERMFAIDHQQLVAGEESIMDAKGDIGRILFEAAAGVGNLGELRKRIDAEAEDLWGPRRKKDHQFTLAENRFTAAKAKLATVSLSAAQWKEADSALKEALAAEAAADAELAESTVRQRQLERIQRVATPLSRYRDASAARAALGTPVAFPEGAGETFAAADGTLAAAKVRRGFAENALAKHEDERTAIVLTPALTERKTDIAALIERRGVVVKAQADLPGVERELADATGEIAQAATALGWQDAGLAAIADRLPSPIVRAEVAGHFKKLPDLVHTADTARRDFATKRDEIARLTGLLDAAPDASDLPALAHALADAQALNYGPAVVAADAELRAAETTLEAARAALVPWVGTTEDLRSSLFPTAPEATALLEERAGLEATCQSIEDQLEREATAVTQAEAAVAAHARERLPVTAEAVQAQRATRDRLWQSLRDGEQALAAGADAYEQEVRVADETADRRYEDADFIAKARELANIAEARRHEHAATAARLARMARDLSRLNARWAERIAGVPGSVFIPLEQYATWAQARDACLAAQRSLQDLRAARTGLDDRAAALATRLRNACAEAGSPGGEESFPLAVAHATKLQAQRAEARMQQQGWRTAREQQEALLAPAKTAHEQAEGALRAWQDERAALLAGAGIAPQLGNDGVEAALAQLAEIATGLKEAQRLGQRVRSMGEEIATFATDAAALATACAPDLAGLPATEIASVLDTRVRAEAQRVTDHARLTADIAASHAELDAIATEEGTAHTTLAPLFAVAKADGLDALRAAVEHWNACCTADAKVEAAREATLANSDGLAFEVLEAEVAAEDLAALPAALDAVKRRAEEVEGKRKKAVEVRTTKQAALDRYMGQDDAVRAEADKQDALLLMREAAEGYFRQALGARLLGWATSRYAERKHEPLLKLASSLFAKLTLGNFERLALGQDGEEAKLYAYRPDGDHIVFGKGLSTGTEAQLYLALRLASLHQHVDAGNVLPFLGDDLVVGWDEERVAAGIEVLADLARKTQVILLTHSAKVAEIAKATLGAVNVAELPRNVPKAA